MFCLFLTIIPCNRRLCFPCPSQRPGMRTGQWFGSGQKLGLWVSSPRRAPCTHQPSTQDGSRAPNPFCQRRCTHGAHALAAGICGPRAHFPLSTSARGVPSAAARSLMFQALRSPPPFPGRRGRPAPHGGQFGANVAPTYEITSALGCTVDLLNAVS